MKILRTLFLLVLTFSVFAQDKLTEEEMGMFAKNVVVPLPSEIIVALDKLSDVDWDKAVDYNYAADYTENHKIALNIGVKVAYGFIAIQARDKKNIGEMFNVTRTLAENFGAKSTLFAKKEEIINYVKNEEWSKLRRALDDMQASIKVEMNKYHPDFVVLASVGGWIEGLNVVSKALSENYNADASNILFQPLLVQHFQDKLRTLQNEENRNNPTVKSISMKLSEVYEILVNVPTGKPVPEAMVKRLYEISSALISEIERGE